MTAFTLTLIFVSVLATSFLSGIFGMAGGMILIGIFMWVLTVPQAMMLHATVQFFANASRVWVHRQHIYYPTLIVFLIGLMVCFGLFSFLMFTTNKLLVFLLLGISPFVAVMLPKKWALDFTKPLHAFICGVSITFFQLTSGTGGPFMHLFFQTDKLTRHQTVASKSTMMSISHIMKFVYFGFVVSNQNAWENELAWWIYATCIPLAISGTYLGKSFLARLSDKQFYRITQGLLFVIGTIYIVKSIQLWLGT